jgi:hypothetical protein
MPGYISVLVRRAKSIQIMTDLTFLPSTTATYEKCIFKISNIEVV